MLLRMTKFLRILIVFINSLHFCYFDLFCLFFLIILIIYVKFVLIGECNMDITSNSSKMEVMSAVKMNGMLIFKASNELQHDKDVIFAAINQNINVLYKLDHIYYDDKEVILAAIKKDKDCFFAKDLISTRLLMDMDVCMALVKKNGLMLEYILIPFFDTRYKKLASAAINENPYAFELLPSMYHDDYDLALLAVSKDGLLIKSVSPRLRNNKVIALTAVSVSRNALKYLDNLSLYSDDDIDDFLIDSEVGNHKHKIEQIDIKNNKIRESNSKKTKLIDELNNCLVERKKLLAESEKLDREISKKLSMINSIGGKTNGRK